MPACPRLVCSFNRGNIERTNSLKVCVGCLCMYALFCVCVGTRFVDWLEKGFMYGVDDEFDWPDVTLCSRQDVKTNY